MQKKKVSFQIKCNEKGEHLILDVNICFGSD